MHNHLWYMRVFPYYIYKHRTYAIDCSRWCRLANRIQTNSHSFCVHALIFTSHCQNLFRLHRCQMGRCRSWRSLPALSGLLITSTWFQIRSDPFPSTFSKFRKLSCAWINNCLNLLFWLLRYRNHAIQILVDEQTHKHLGWGKVDIEI